MHLYLLSLCYLLIFDSLVVNVNDSVDSFMCILGFVCVSMFGCERDVELPCYFPFSEMQLKEVE